MTTRELFTELPDASLPQIAAVIAQDWDNIDFAALPYLDAMYCINTVDDHFMQDSGAHIVQYFLSNASTWRGPVARAVKAELRARVKT